MVRAHDLLFYVSLARGHRANLITGNCNVNRCRQCSQINLFETRCFREAYTGLPVVRVTENQKALNCVVLKYSIPVSEE